MGDYSEALIADTVSYTNLDVYKRQEAQYEYWVDTLPFYRNVRDEGVVING